MLNRAGLHVLAVAILATYSSAVLAYRYQITDRICIPDAGFPPIERRILIPVGCKLVDCCPGCPASGPLEWRIKVDAKVLQGAELRFDGLGAAELKKLRITGNARIDGDRILLRRGSSRIRGIPDRIGGKVAVGSLLPVVGQDAEARVRSRESVAAAASARRGRGGTTDQLIVQQYLGLLPVNDFRWVYIIKSCPVLGQKPHVPWDTLKVPNASPGESVVVMLDARTGSDPADCANDMLFTSTGTSALTNLRASGTCNSEVVVFSKSNRMLLESPVATWTNASGDVHTTPPLEPVIDVPLTVWIADAAATVRAVEEVNNANQLYRQNRTGIQFNPTYMDKSGDTAAVTTINNGLLVTATGSSRCDDLQGLKDNGLYTDKALNVYYIDKDFYGRNCAIRQTPPACSGTGNKGDGNITYIGRYINLVAVAHEVGHAFGLRPGRGAGANACGGHTDYYSDATGNWVNLPGFTDDNIMRTEAPDLANHFTLGQIFRMHTQKDEWDGTMIIQNGLRPESDRRECTPPYQPVSARCPALATDLP